MAQALEQRTDFVAATQRDTAGQVATGNTVEVLARAAQRPQHHAIEKPIAGHGNE